MGTPQRPAVVSVQVPPPMGMGMQPPPPMGMQPPPPMGMQPPMGMVCVRVVWNREHASVSAFIVIPVVWFVQGAPYGYPPQPDPLWGYFSAVAGE